jgi:hypothetical protein
MPPTVPTRIGAIAGRVAAGIHGRRGLDRAALALALLILVVAGIVFRHSWSWGDFPTWVLAAGAIVTVYYARKAFREQSRELGVLQRQAKQQADMFDDQQKVNEEQVRVLKLQAKELQASLDQRKGDAESQRREQANKVAAWFATKESARGGGPLRLWGALIRNDSDLPILNVRVFFHFIESESPAARAWKPVNCGGPPGRIRVIPPRSQKFVEILETIRTQRNECDDSAYVVSIEFSDAAGNYWERTARGALKPMQPPDDEGGAAPPLTA